MLTYAGRSRKVFLEIGRLSRDLKERMSRVDRERGCEAERTVSTQVLGGGGDCGRRGGRERGVVGEVGRASPGRAGLQGGS